MISLSVLISAVIFFSKILFERSNFIVTLNEQINPDSSINWTNREFSIVVVDKLGNVFPDSERIFEITGTYFKPINNGTDAILTMKKLNMESCNYEKHFTENNELWRKEKKIFASVCLKKDQDFELITNKPFGTLNYTNMVFWIHMCKNTTIKNNCYSEDKIKQILLNAFTNIKIIDIYFDHNDKDQPAKPYIFSDKIQTSTTIYKRVYYTFKNIDYYIDDNYIFTDNMINSYVNIADYKEAVDLRPLNSTTIPNTFLAISFSNNVKKQIFYKKYYKAQNMIADVGGIIKSILLIATIINNKFDERLYFADLINYNNGVMNISIDKDDNKLNFKEFSNIDKKNKLSLMKNSENNVIIENPVFINYVNKNKIDIKEKHKINFPIYISCIPKCLFTRKSNYRYVFDKLDYIVNIVKKQLDVKFIISKLNNIDKLSFLFFGKYDYSVLDEAANPYIQEKLIELKSIDIKSKIVDSESVITRLNKNYNILLNIK